MIISLSFSLSLSLSSLSPCFQCKIIIHYHTYDTNISLSSAMLPFLAQSMLCLSIAVSPLSLYVCVCVIVCVCSSHSISMSLTEFAFPGGQRRRTYTKVLRTYNFAIETYCTPSKATCFIQFMSPHAASSMVPMWYSSIMRSISFRTVSCMVLCVTNYNQKLDTTKTARERGKQWHKKFTHLGRGKERAEVDTTHIHDAAQSNSRTGDARHTVWWSDDPRPERLSELFQKLVE